MNGTKVNTFVIHSWDTLCVREHRRKRNKSAVAAAAIARVYAHTRRVWPPLVHPPMRPVTHALPLAYTAGGKSTVRPCPPPPRRLLLIPPAVCTVAVNAPVAAILNRPPPRPTDRPFALVAKAHAPSAATGDRARRVSVRVNPTARIAFANVRAVWLERRPWRAAGRVLVWAQRRRRHHQHPAPATSGSRTVRANAQDSYRHRLATPSKRTTFW